MPGQTQHIINKAETILMCINRCITSNPEWLRSNNVLCNYISADAPSQDTINSNLILMHKMFQNKKPDQIVNHLNFLKRSFGKVNVKDYPLSYRSRRSPLVAGVQLNNAIPQNYRIFPKKMLKKKLKA